MSLETQKKGTAAQKPRAAAGQETTYLRDYHCPQAKNIGGNAPVPSPVSVFFVLTHLMLTPTRANKCQTATIQSLLRWLQMLFGQLCCSRE
jgi:hypothetical protein